MTFKFEWHRYVFLVLFILFCFTASARVLYVSPNGNPAGPGTSWETAFTTISASLTASASGDEIWVQSATYSESIAMKPYVSIFGGFTGDETRRGARDWDNQETKINASGLGKSVVYGANHAVLNGFTITGGTGDTNGGGVSCRYSSPILVNCTVTGNSARYGGGVCCDDQSSPVLINCILTGNSAMYGAGFSCDVKSSPRLINCTIADNTASDYGGGAYIISFSSPMLTNCTISGNSASDYGGGLYLGSRSSPGLTNCLIVGNSTNEGGGIYCRHISNPSLTNCTLADNVASLDGAGIYCFYLAAPTLTNCLLWNKGKEIVAVRDSTPTVQYSSIQGGWPGEGNIDGDPLFENPADGDYHLCEGSACVDRGLVSAAPAEDLEGHSRPGGDGLVDMGAYESPDAWQPGSVSHTPTRWYVRANASDGGNGTSWASAWPNITSALRVAGTSDEVWVQAGTYHETIALESGVAIYGGFTGNETNRNDRDGAAYKTTINASGWDRAVVIGADNAILDGFTLTGGFSRYGGGLCCFNSSPSLNNCIIKENLSSYIGIRGRGGGIFCDHSSPNLTNCTITDNTAMEYGGGVYCDNESSPALTNCHIAGNSAKYGAGVCCTEDSSPNLTGCTMNSNLITLMYGRGGGLYCDNSSPTLTNCTINYNSSTDSLYSYGSGIYCIDSTPTLTTCNIAGNSAIDGGGLYCQTSAPILIDCKLTGNSASEEGGGVFCWYYSYPTLRNCIISGNTATNSGGVYCKASSPTLINCMISNNSASDAGGIGCHDHSSPDLTNCTITGNSAEQYSGGGVGCLISSSPKLKNCILSDNSAKMSGGGLFCYEGSSPTLLNCTITANSARDGGGLFSYDVSLPVITNCIFWDNGSEILDVHQPLTSVTYCCIEGGRSGEGNISSDPLFVDAGGGDYRLQVGSSCIDAGNPASLYNDDCLPPGLGGVRNDIGAYGGPENCGFTSSDPTPLPTMTPTPTPTSTPTITCTPTETPLPGQPQVWVLDGLGRVQMLNGAQE